MGDSPRIRLDDGSSWPRPNYHDIGWRLNHAPLDSFSRSDLYVAAAIIEAYAHLIQVPTAARKLPAVRRALAREEG